MSNEVAALERLGACSESLDWLCARSGTWQDAWDACERGDWMGWLVAMLAWRTPWGTPGRRRLHGMSGELRISLARPFSIDRTDAAIDGMIALLRRSERGEEVTETDFSAGAAGADSLRASADIIRARYPEAPDLGGV